MGNASSADASVAYTHGLHVVRVKPNSPGQKAGLIPYFDYIVVANDYPLNQQNNAFVHILQDNLNKPVQTIVYNSKTEKTREVTIVPRNDWDENSKELLGVSIRFCNIKTSTEYVWHVLEVFPNSPASKAGLKPFTDYIVGATSLVFQSSEDFFNLVASNMNKQLDFFVYNSEEDSIRMVSLTPNKQWGGQGSIGCNVAYGLLHKIPTKQEEKTTLDIPKLESLPSAVTKMPISEEPTKEITVKSQQPLEVITTDSSQKVEETVPQSTPIISNDPHPPKVSTNLPNTYSATLPDTRIQKESESINLPSAESHNDVTSSVSQPMDLDALKKKQEQLQQQLQKLRMQMN